MVQMPQWPILLGEDAAMFDMLRLSPPSTGTVIFDCCVTPDIPVCAEPAGCAELTVIARHCTVGLVGATEGIGGDGVAHPVNGLVADGFGRDGVSPKQ